MTRAAEAEEALRTTSNSRRGSVLGVLNGALFGTSEASVDPQTVLSWFLAQLGASNVLIGLIGPIRRSSAFVLQLLVSGHLERQPYKLPYCRAISLFRVAGLITLALAAALIPVGNPWPIVVFFVVCTAYSMGAGLVSLPFLDLVGKAIPQRRRRNFFTVYAQRTPGMPDGSVGLYLGARTAASLTSNLLWGPLSDRRGNRRVMRILMGTGLLAPLLALTLGHFGEGARGDLQSVFSYGFAGVFVLLGAYDSRPFVAYGGYLLDLAPEAERPLYTAFSSTAFGLASLAALASGMIVNAAGLGTLFTVPVTCFGLALLISSRMGEPRYRPAHAVANP